MNWQEATTLESFLAATRRAACGKKIQPPVARFLMDAERECLRLQDSLRLPVDHANAWWPAAPHQFQIRDPKPRMISVAPFADRVVHHVLCATFEPILERYSIHHSYACWRGKGQHRALHQCQRFARRADWALKGDVSSFFASIPHDRLLARLHQRVRHAEISAWVQRVLAGPHPGVPSSIGRGLPIGALTSQHLANFYLGHLDHWLTDDLGFGNYLRYMDDFVVFGTRSDLRRLLPKIRTFLVEELDLRLNEKHSRVQPVRTGIPFLGFRVFRHQIRISHDRWRRFRQCDQALRMAYSLGELDEEALAASQTSLYAHFQAFDTYPARRAHLAKMARHQGRGRTRVQPRATRRLLEERPAEHARCEPQQERSLQAQPRRGLSRCEFKTSQHPGVLRPVGVASRSGFLRPGLDQTIVPCSGHEGIFLPQSGTETYPPESGVSRVALRSSFFYSS